jgi:hypothetical protein
MQTLSDMLANGQISRTTYTRYSQTPDTDQLQDILNAPQETIDRQLDALLDGEYIPPTPFGDLPYALAQVEARYCYESNIDTPEHILDLYLQYRAAVRDLIQDQATPDVMPPAPGPVTGMPVATPPANFGALQANAPVAPSGGQIPPMQVPVGTTAAVGSTGSPNGQLLQ